VLIFPRKLLLIVYLVIGAVVAASKDYLENLDTARRLASALLAIALWPLLFLGIDLHINS
jgi:ABC-type Na+ efflux pump permease subunit